jgi:hypothetical protein
MVFSSKMAGHGVLLLAPGLRLAAAFTHAYFGRS